MSLSRLLVGFQLVNALASGQGSHGMRVGLSIDQRVGVSCGCGCLRRVLPGGVWGGGMLMGVETGRGRWSACGLAFRRRREGVHPGGGAAGRQAVWYIDAIVAAAGRAARMGAAGLGVRGRLLHRGAGFVAGPGCALDPDDAQVLPLGGSP